ncbi:MAG: Asp23/Gls24 family envelope stress response protein [Erysipelothrix sp.]|nr:Asp23/Gls24 family envelope stress response protein [Erysipelothrix sp.]
MSIERMTQLGNIHISQEAIAMLAGGVVTECYGVVGMASQKVLKDGFAELLKKENFTKGVVVRKDENGFEIDLYIVLMYGIRISEVVASIQQKVKYMLEKSLEQSFTKVNIYVQGLKVNE